MPIGDLLASITGESSTASKPNPFLNRKSPSDNRRSNVQPGTNGSSTSASTISKRPHVADTASTREALAKQPLARTNGANRSNAQLAARSTVAPRPTATAPSTKPQTAPAAPPKKGSFKEIMARAASAQSLVGSIGKIQHKRIEKAPSRRDRDQARTKMGQRIEEGLAPGSKFDKNTNDTRRAPIPSNTAAEPVKKVRKATLATTGYMGTARSKAPVKKPSSFTAKATSRSHASRLDRDGHRYDDEMKDDDDDDDDESRYGRSADEHFYDSEGSSDMEAAAFEVDEEEERASKIARLEDAAAADEETRLKREKLEKRQRLAQLAAKRR